MKLGVWRVCELHVSGVGGVAAHHSLLARAPRVVELCPMLDGVVRAGRLLAAHGLVVQKKGRTVRHQIKV